MLATEQSVTIPGLLRDLGLGMAALYFVVKLAAPQVAALFTDQRTRLAAADAATLERLKRSEEEVRRLTAELIDSARKEAAARAEALAASTDHRLVIRERDDALASCGKAKAAMLDAQSVAARMRANLDSQG